jgi:mono/diheme cytochrome c family protein
LGASQPRAARARAPGSGLRALAERARRGSGRQLADTRGGHASASRARRVSGSCRQLHGLPHRPGRGELCGRPRHPDAVRHDLRTNLTPDTATGIGAWSADEFWRALHNGRARDGRLLYPAFPYPNYTRVSREDSDAIHAYLQSLPAVSRANTPHALQFPFDQQAALAVWRALYFRPERPKPDPARSAEWNRGAYLVEGLGHCNACHASRNALGATSSTLDLAGGLIPVQNWYAPSLTSPAEAGVADWDTQHIVDLMRSGVSARGAVMGPMREVVGGSTQYLDEPDLHAMANYLKALPQTPVEAAASNVALDPPPDSPGGKLYTQHCVDCHGERGEGVVSVYPALAGSRAVTLRTPANLVHMVLEGGFPPTTVGNPRPYGMPPFATVLSDTEVGELLSYVRASWGNRAEPVSTLQVAQFRSVK